MVNVLSGILRCFAAKFPPILILFYFPTKGVALGYFCYALLRPTSLNIAHTNFNNDFIIPPLGPPIYF